MKYPVSSVKFPIDMKIPNLYLLELLLFFPIDVRHLIFFLQNCHVQIKTTYRVQKADVDGSAIFVHHHWLPVTTMHNDMTSHKLH